MPRSPPLRPRLSAIAPRRRKPLTRATGYAALGELTFYKARDNSVVIIVVSPFATEFLVNGETLRISKVDIAVGADVGGHRCHSLKVVG